MGHTHCWGRQITTCLSGECPTGPAQTGNCSVTTGNVQQEPSWAPPPPWVCLLFPQNKVLGLGMGRWSTGKPYRHAQTSWAENSPIIATMGNWGCWGCSGKQGVVNWQAAPATHPSNWGRAGRNLSKASPAQAHTTGGSMEMAWGSLMLWGWGQGGEGSW